MERWEKDRFAETAYKRLYWQGYNGCFGSFRWPTLSGFEIIFWQNPAPKLWHFDSSEFNAWKSGAPLRQRLVKLNASHPGQVHLIAHSMGNIVAGEALRTNTVTVNTYVAMQAAVAAHAYDGSASNRSIAVSADDKTFNYYAHYWQSNSPAYFNESGGAAHYANFYNPVDYALRKWQLDQDLKPDDSLAYKYHTNAPSNYFTKGVLFYNYLMFPEDTHELFSFCVEARCYPLGAQSGVGGVFDTAMQINLAEAPYAFGDLHKEHSAQFRSTHMLRAPFWAMVVLRLRIE